MRSEFPTGSRAELVERWEAVQYLEPCLLMVPEDYQESANEYVRHQASVMGAASKLAGPTSPHGRIGVIKAVRRSLQKSTETLAHFTGISTGIAEIFNRSPACASKTLVARHAAQMLSRDARKTLELWCAFPSSGSWSSGRIRDGAA